MCFNRSQKNVEHAERPIAQGCMQAAVLARVSLGRWLMKAQPNDSWHSTRPSDQTLLGSEFLWPGPFTEASTQSVTIYPWWDLMLWWSQVGCIHSLHTQCVRASGEKIQGKTANQVLSGFRKIPDPVQALKISILRPNQSVALLRSRINDAVGQRQLVAYT